MSAETIYGIAVLAPSQKAATDANCFGDCGAISMGGVIDDPITGGLFVCPRQTCPHTDREIEEYGTTNSFGRQHTVTLRILRDYSAGDATEAAHA